MRPLPLAAGSAWSRWLTPPVSTRDEAGDELGWLMTSDWSSLAILVMVAVAVLLVGGMLSRGAEARRSARRRRSDFDLEVARMESLPVTATRELVAGPAHVVGTVHSSVGALGGPPERACVYRNRAGSDRSTAVGSSLIVIDDGAGRVSVESLEQARVLAPKQSSDGPHETISLHIGDHVQVLGEFAPEVSGDGDPATRVYGSFGTAGAVQLKVVERPPARPAGTDESPPTESP